MRKTAEEVDAHLHANADNAGGGQRQESHDIRSDDDEAQRDEVPSVDLHETMPVQQDLIDAVPPFIPPPKWMVMAHPASRHSSGRGKDWLRNLKEDGVQHRTSRHVSGLKHLKVMTGFIIRTESLRRSHICWTWNIMESPRNG